MKTLPFTEKELIMLTTNAKQNYSRIMEKIKEVTEDFTTQEHTVSSTQQYFDILNRLHQQAMIYSNQVRKYCGMKKVMYSE